MQSGGWSQKWSEEMESHVSYIVAFRIVYLPVCLVVRVDVWDSNFFFSVMATERYGENNDCVSNLHTCGSGLFT